MTELLMKELLYLKRKRERILKRIIKEQKELVKAEIRINEIDPFKGEKNAIENKIISD